MKKNADMVLKISLLLILIRFTYTPKNFFMSSLFASLAKKIFPPEREVYNTRQIELDKICPGYPDPCTLSTVIEIVLQSEKYIVTIDESLSINWMTNNKYTEFAKDFSSVTSKVQLLSMQINRLFTKRAERYKYTRIVAEALALVLEEKRSVNAMALLKEAEYRITEHGRQRAGMAYIYYATFTAFLVGILLCVVVQNKNAAWLFGTDVNRYQIAVATFLGGIGAFISAFMRFRNYKANITAGLSMHRLDGFLRVLYGCAAALIFTLAIYSNTIFGFLNTTAVTQPWVIYFFATIAGATEFLIPNLINKTAPESIVKKRDEAVTGETLVEKTVLLYKNKENGEEARNGERLKDETKRYEYDEDAEKKSGYFVQGKIHLQD